jgi:hypothetical protein
MRNLINSGFKPYNKEELLSKIKAIEISKQGNLVVTKYFDRVINTTQVSDLYEIFDIKFFLISKFEQLSNNFTITWYKFVLKSGIQELVLLSDSVDINSCVFYKAFFILNSSDKSRRLNMNMGLYRADNNSYLVGSIKNMSLSKKHLKGVTQKLKKYLRLLMLKLLMNRLMLLSLWLVKEFYFQRLEKLYLIRIYK